MMKDWLEKMLMEGRNWCPWRLKVGVREREGGVEELGYFTDIYLYNNI